MSNGQEELLNLHGPLTSDAQKQPEYRDNTETAIYGYSEGVEHALETVWIKGYRKPRNGAAAVTGMENVLAEHYDVELEHGYWSCICGERFGVLLPDELHRAHVAEALTLAGFGNLHDAWADGANYSAAHPIANMADRDRVNPYRTQL